MSTTRRREGTYTCERCGTRHQFTGRHDDGAWITRDDQPELARQILAFYAACDGHQSVSTMLLALRLPGPVDGRTRQGRARLEQVLEAHVLTMGMADDGLLTVVEEACGTESDRFGWGMAITEAGRRYLAARSHQ